MAVTISLAITQNSQNVSNNTSNVTVKVTAKWTSGSWNAQVSADGTPQAHGSLTIDGTSYSFRSTFNEGHTTSGSQTIFTKTVNVSHNSEGKKTLSCSAIYNVYLNSASSVSASASKALTTIPRTSTLSVANGTLNTAQTLTVTKQASSFTHTITATCGNMSRIICTRSSSTSISFTPPIDWASQNTTGTTVSVTYKITTFNGDTSIGSNSYSKTCSIPSSVKPSCSITVTDAMGYADTYGGYIKGLSKFKVVVSGTTSYDSPIESYSATANGEKYTSASFTTGVLTASGTQSVSATVKDKRGRSGSDSVSVNVLDYSAPIVSKFTVHRCNADGTENDKGTHVEVRFSGSVTPLNNKNTAKYTLEYKKTSQKEYTTVALTNLNNNYSVVDSSYIFAAETGSSYNVRLTVVDNFNSASNTTSASTAFTLMHWLASGLGMAIGKIAELENVLDIGFQTRFMGGILHPVLEAETDLDDVRTPNTYVGANLATYKYANCPLTNGTFTLEVVGMGEAGQVKQRVTSCRKDDARAFERIYYSSGWGEWVCVSDYAGTLLWDGTSYMAADSTANLAEAVSKQKSGIVLVFSEYVNGASADQSFHCRFIPKMRVSMKPGKADCIQLTTSNLSFFATKYLYISDDKITGHANNNATGTGTCGITYTNNRFVLRYVIGV